jgi:hypothetical protein
VSVRAGEIAESVLADPAARMEDHAVADDGMNDL